VNVRGMQDGAAAAVGAQLAQLGEVAEAVDGEQVENDAGTGTVYCSSLR
jgi:hypothetical protein